MARIAFDWNNLYRPRKKGKPGMTLVTPLGEIRLKKLGAGAFSEVFEVPKAARPEDRVLAFTDDATSDKDMLANLFERAPPGVRAHLPAVRRLGSTRRKKVYAMPKYDKLTKKRAPKAWRDFQGIRKCFEAQSARQTVFDGAIFNQGIVDCVDKRKDVSRGSKRTLRFLVKEAADYGPAVTIEIAQRNLAVGGRNKKLIFLDPTFDAEELRRIRIKAEAMANAANRWGNRKLSLNIQVQEQLAEEAWSEEARSEKAGFHSSDMSDMVLNTNERAELRYAAYGSDIDEDELV